MATKSDVMKQRSRKRERRKVASSREYFCSSSTKSNTLTQSVRIEAQDKASFAYFILLLLSINFVANCAQLELVHHKTQVRDLSQPNGNRQAPASSTCSLRPFESAESAESASETTTNDDDDQADDQWRVKQASRQVKLVRLQDNYYDRLAQMSLNTSVQLFKKERLANQNRQLTTQVAFESICNGWRNSLEPSGKHPPAYWIYDKLRGVLVAKFIFYSKDEYLDITSRNARLTSPIFPPIPAYHSMPDSVYYSSCKATFKAYLTIAAHLEFSLVLIATTASSGAAGSPGSVVAASAPEPPPASSGGDKQPSMSRNRIVREQQEQQSLLLPTQQPAQQRSHLLKEIIEGKLPRGKMLADREGEQAAWTEHQVVMPHDLGPSGLYVLEFSAIPGTVSSGAVKQGSYLNGVAIANFSLSPQCFGLEVEKAELERIKNMTGVDPFQRFDLADLDLANKQSIHPRHSSTLSTSSSLYTNLVHFFDTYRIAFLIGCILVLVIVVCLSQYLLCAVHRDFASKTLAKQNGSSSTRSGGQPISWTSRLCFSCCCCFYCCLPASSRRRVYATGKSNSKHAGAKHTGANCFGPDSDKFRDALDSQRDGMRNYLRPLQSALDNLELNENPNYLANGTRTLNAEQWQSAAKAISVLLEPYSINRKRLTLTKPLGKGAFGEVYQGYLICYCSDSSDAEPRNDVKTSLATIGARLATTTAAATATTMLNGELEEDLESHSVKVAVKTLTDERMSQNDFIREASNMSLVNHRNIVELIGVCFEEKPLYIVMELLQGGNLKHFLLKNRDKGHYKPAQNNCLYMQPNASPTPAQIANDTESIWHASGNNAPNQEAPSRVRLSMGDLLVFALDIARACDYLQKKQFIHRDLAARNCLLTASFRANNSNCTPLCNTPLPFAQNGSIQPRPASRATSGSRSFVGALPSALDVHANHKVDLDQVFLDGFQNSSIVAKLADFGMTRDVYSTDYYRMSHKEMPVRWMPPECLDGVATTKSDVWSFGVFLWELFSMGQMPYQGRDNNKVIEFIQARRCAKRKLCLAQQQQQQQTQKANMSPIKENEQLAQVEASENLHEGLQGQMDRLTMHQSTSTAPLLANMDETGLLEADENEAAEEPPLPLPHYNTPQPIYAIMCACWSTIPEERPQFEEIANRIYWCLQMPEVLNTSLPCFYEQPAAATSGAINSQQAAPPSRSESRASMEPANQF